MSISFEDAVKTLKSMFPEWDEEMLGVILESNQYHVERTIEVVLSMSGEQTGESTAVDSTNNEVNQRGFDSFFFYNYYYFAYHLKRII